VSARRLHLVLVAGLMLAATVPPAGAGEFDADSARVKARALVPFVVHAEAAPLWREFDATMRAALKDSAAFAATLASMQAQTGALDSLLSDSVSTPQPGLFLYRARCRFAKFPQPLELSLAFDGDGRVSGLLLRPPPDQPRQEYPSPHLDYRDRTALKLPVRGEWSVVWGGRTLKQNYHAFTRDQRFALDLLIVRDGHTHAGDGKRLADYYCYGQPVLAPAAGIVVWVQDGLPDNPPGQMDPAHATGNSLIIAHGNGEYSLIAHLQPGSLRLKTGDQVNADDELGRCGNSGNTSEPHVHYHLQNGPKPFDADGLPVTFVDLVVDGKPVEAAEIVQGQTVRRAH
jgi:murein DD-endopeptidase MepM/ murein hydrolase activator NlpD